MTSFPTHRSGWRVAFLSLFAITMGGLLYVAIVYIQPINTSNLDLHIGTVAPVDLIAPFSTTFESEILTEQARDTAGNAIPPAYLPTDLSIARQQVDALRGAVDFIHTTRADSFASFEQKLEDLALLNVDFSREFAEKILLLSDEEWQTVMNESILVLQQVMRTTIREGQLEDARRSIPTLVSFALPEDQVSTVTELAGAYVAPNSFYSEELTEQHRQAARDAVEPVTRTFVIGETVVRRGKALNDLDIEALQQLGLLVSQNDPLRNLNAWVMVILSMAFILLFLYRRPAFSSDFRNIFYTCFYFLAFLYIGRLTIFDSNAWPYLYPLTAFGLLIGALFGPQPGMFFMLPLSLLITYGMSNTLELAVFYFLSGVFGVLMLDRARRVMAHLWAGLGAGIAGAVALLAFRLLDPFTDINTLTIFAGASILSGVASGIIALLFLFLSSPLLDKVTIIQLTELSRPDHPLLKFLLMNAPGTYQHSLQVANLSEQAAEQIGADALLTRIGALYHDVGKALAPQYFIENQVPGAGNPHDNIDPYESSAIIIRHVTDGIGLAHKHRLPKRIVDFIAEHHGTTATRFQYAKALQAAGNDTSKVSLDDFRYPGPRPHSRETALVMIADGCEARARAEHPQTEADIRALIKDVIDKRIAGGQLDENHLTMRDIHLILESFTTTLRSIYHPRIAYPELEEPTLAAEEVPTLLTAGEPAAEQPPPSEPSETPLEPSPAPLSMIVENPLIPAAAPTHPKRPSKGKALNPLPK